MKTKIQVVLMLVAIATALPLTSGNMSNIHMKINGLLSNQPHLPPVDVPQNGGNLPPPCLPGGNCAK